MPGENKAHVGHFSLLKFYGYEPGKSLFIYLIKASCNERKLDPL